MQFSKRQRRFLGIGAAAFFSFFLLVLILGRHGKGTGLDSLLIATVKRGELELTVMDIGKIEPHEKVAIKSKVAGRIGAVLVDEGVRVKKGQLLLELESEEFDRNVERARQEVRKMRVETDLAKLIMRRRHLAMADRGVAQTEVDSARSEYLAKRIALTEAKEALQASLDQQRYSRLLSPIDGIIISRNGRAGETVVPGTMATMDDRALLTVADLSVLIAKTELTQIDVAKVKLGQEVSLVIDALPGKTYHARVTRIAPTSTQPPGREMDVFPIEATLYGNDLENIRPGMTCDMTIHVATKKNVLILPIEAVTQKPGHAFVNLVRGEGLTSDQPPTTMVEVRIGMRNDRSVEILSGLKEGDHVLIKPPSAEASEYQ